MFFTRHTLVKKMESSDPTILALRERIKTLEARDVPTICPITHDTIQDMVVCDKDGRCYEARAIQAWLAINPTSPMTKVPASPDSLHHTTSIHAHIVNLHAEVEALQKMVVRLTLSNHRLKKSVQQEKTTGENGREKEASC